MSTSIVNNIGGFREPPDNASELEKLFAKWEIEEFTDNYGIGGGVILSNSLITAQFNAVNQSNTMGGIITYTGATPFYVKP